MTGVAGRIAGTFINSKLTPLFIGASLLLGFFSILKLPREEEPQIVVPMVDVFVGLPGASVAEVEERVTRPMEKLLWEIPGVEYIYSTSSPGGTIAIVRFKVGDAAAAAADHRTVCVDLRILAKRMGTSFQELREQGDGR
jgi:multidrug efflux pump subunit AcrB